ncbi:MAG: response regulator [Deltaproteobacteria bacterium]|nr:response regulator [Deltaproteobacteria bacterium]
MTRKPTYDELEQRIRSLEAEVQKYKSEGDAVVGDLDASEGKYRKIVKQSPMAIEIYDRHGTFQEANNAWRELWGVDPEPFIGKTNVLEPGTVETIGMHDHFKRAFAGEDLSLPDVKFEPTKVGLRGHTRWVHSKLYSLKDRNGNVKNVIHVIQDFTRRKEVEEERLALETKILQAQKMESLGILAGGIAHDFNNLLMGVLGNADLALANTVREAPSRGNISAIVTAAKRAADLAKQMLAYSGKGKFVIKRMDLQTLLEEMVHLLEVSISKQAVIKYDFSDSVPPIEADATQIRQIIMNLVVNASDAIGKKSGVISISTGAMECDRNYLSETFLENDLSEGPYAYFEISDTGDGIAENAVDKIFDPFYTTKFTGRGLGLAAVLGIVRGHRGALKVYSEPGKGTTFKVLFPIVEGDAAVNEVPVSEEIDATLKGISVLLVDDEETIRTVGKQMLEVLGFEAVTAEDGKQALEIFKQNPDRFDCIILDLTMPHLDGEETFREMRRIRKDICVLLSSGYNEQDLISRFASKGPAGFIQKPYQTVNLRDALLDALHKVSEK